MVRGAKGSQERNVYAFPVSGTHFHSTASALKDS